MLSHVCWKVGLGVAAAAVILGVSPPPAFAQEAAGVGTVEGTVRETGSNHPVQGAQVSIAGTTMGAITNPNGVYRIPNVPARQVDVRVRFVGFAPATRQVVVVPGETVTANFDLSQSALQLEQVVTTGTGGAVELKKLGNTVATIEPPQFAPINTVGDLLQGREPGVVGLPSGGLTGDGARIRIRGNASLSQSNEPIVFVDGLRINSSGDFSNNVGAGGGGTPSRIDDIDPTSIERIEILKGAAAATLYGTEASNGVIQIFTKKGTVGVPRWTFNLQQDAISYPKDRIKQNSGFARRQGQADSLSRFYGFTIAPYQVFEQAASERIMETGKATTINGSVTGGNTGITYFISGRYAVEDGPILSLGPAADKNRKAQTLVNLTALPFSALKLGARASYANVRQETINNNNNIYAPLTLAIFAKPEVANCVRSIDATIPNDIGLTADGSRTCRGPGNEFGNTLFMTVQEGFQLLTKQTVDRFTGVFDAAYTVMSELTLSGLFGVDYTSSQNSEFQPFGYNTDHFTTNDTLGFRTIQDNNTREITLDSKLNWNRDFSPRLSSSFVAGAQAFFMRNTQPGGENTNFPGPGIEVAEAGDSPVVLEDVLATVNGGYFAQEQLGFDNWIFLTGGARYDYSSAFGENAGAVLYPKVSLSVIPSDLPRWGSDMVSTLRLRGAWGQSGRQPGAFDKLTTFESIAGTSGSGLVSSNLGNPDLKPEISTEYEAGAELGILQDRIGFDFTYWNRTVSDLLVAKQFPISGGFRSTQLANVGEMKAHGLEMSVKAFVVNRPGIAFDVFANTAYLKQKVTDLGGAPPLKVGGSYPRYRNFIKEGEAPGAMFGAKLPELCSLRPAGATYTCLNADQVPYDRTGPVVGTPDGLPDTEAQFLAYLGSAAFVGTADKLSTLNPLRVDEDGDGDFLDHYLGKPYPDWSGAFGGTLTFARRWRLYSLFEYKGGNYTITNLTDAFRNAHPSIGRNTPGVARLEAEMLNPATTAERRLALAKEWATKYKALSPFDGMNQNEPGDFVRFRELSLTYSASPDFAARVGARDLSITFSGRNLALWTKYKGTDPELNFISRALTNASPVGSQQQNSIDNNFGDAIDAFGYPIPRRFQLSVRLGY